TSATGATACDASLCGLGTSATWSASKSKTTDRACHREPSSRFSSPSCAWQKRPRAASASGSRRSSASSKPITAAWASIRRPIVDVVSGSSFRACRNGSPMPASELKAEKLREPLRLFRGQHFRKPGVMLFGRGKVATARVLGFADEADHLKVRERVCGQGQDGAPHDARIHLREHLARAGGDLGWHELDRSPVGGDRELLFG